MTNAKHTKKALFASVMSMLLCCAMLIGTTFAWFTDSASSGENRLQAGKLDIDLLMATENGYESISEGTGNLFKATKWEPGKTEVVYLAVKNNGDLAAMFDCDVVPSAVEGVKNLGDVLQCAVLADREIGQSVGGSWTELTYGLTVGQNLFLRLNAARTAVRDTVVLPGEVKYFAVAVHMNETADNNYMEAAVDIDVRVNATQAQHETDAFGTEYDKNAQFVIESSQDFKRMLTNPVNGATYIVQADAEYPSNVSLNKDEVSGNIAYTIDLNGHKLTFNGNNGYTADGAALNITVTDSSKKKTGDFIINTSSGNLFAGDSGNDDTITGIN